MSVLGKVEIVVCGVLGDVEAWELARRAEQHAAWALTQARAEMESVYPGLEFVIRIGEHGPKPEPERELGAPQGIRINGRGPVIKPEAERFTIHGIEDGDGIEREWIVEDATGEYDAQSFDDEDEARQEVEILRAEGAR